MKKRLKILRDLRKNYIDRLKKSGMESAAFDFDTILEECFGISRTQQLMQSEAAFTKAQEERLSSIVDRYLSGEPLQYLLGRAWFMGLPFYTDKRALIPRSDTEILCEQAIDVLKTMDNPARILDLCSGSGCIGISLLKSFPASSLVMADISKNALALSRKNAASLIPDLKYTIVLSDLFEALDGQVFDLIVSNPPYIASQVIDTLDQRVRDHEPRLALDGGEDGLALYRRMIRNAPAHLSPAGTLLLEIGYDQADAVSKLLSENHFTRIQIVKDYGGQDRVAAAVLSSSSNTV